MTTPSTYAFLHQREGTSRRNRRLPALDAGYAGLDERGMMDLMVFLEGYAKHIRFINKENRHEGDWSVFFDRNLAFVLARMGTVSIERQRADYKASAVVFEESPDPRERREALVHLLQLTLGLFRMVDEWYTASRQDLVHLSENPVARQLSNAIQLRLRPELVRFTELVTGLNLSEWPAGEMASMIDGLNYIWNLKWDAGKPGRKRTPEQELRQISWETSVVHRAVVDTITFLKDNAGQWLQQVLQHYPYHSPDTSLLLSFLKAYGHVQADLNRITRRHLDYYYRRTLRQEIRPASPDHVHVCLVPADHVLKTVIPAGTLLAAGTDEDGREFTYATETDLEVSQTAISDLRVIHVARNPAIGISGRFQSVSDIYAQRIELDPSGVALDATRNPGPFDALGRDQSAIRTDRRSMHQAEVGFAIASPILLLREGDRDIRLTYRFSLQSLTALVSFIEEISTQEGLSADSAFQKILRQVFRVRLTTLDGWFTTSHYQVIPSEDWSSGSFRIDIRLDISDPPVVAFDSEVHDGGYDTRWPVLELVLSTQESMYAYSYLKDLVVNSCTVDVHVSHVKDLQVFNDLGKLDINKPFFPFGSTPGLGSYFLLGNEELMRKHLTALSVDIRWHNLPRGEGGLGAHYSAYGAGVTTSSFKAGITALTDFRFLPAREENVQVFELFSEEGERGSLSDRLSVNPIVLEKFKLKPNYGQVDLSEYNSQIKSGYFKIQMVSPSLGFGFSDFPRLYSEAVVANARAGSGLLNFGDKTVEMPREPFAPQIRSISLDYSATATFAFDAADVASNDRASQDEIYHLHPFGKVRVYRDGAPLAAHLLPQFDEEGYLLIGLTGVHAPVQLSLFIELTSGSGSLRSDPQIPDTSWKYLVGDEWRMFEKEEVLSDTTNHFTTSGIIQLQLPSDIDINHNILPSGICWIAAQAPEDTDVLSRVRFIRTNGVRAVWAAHKSGAQWARSVPAGTINSLLNSRSEVNGVVQPFPSFGGNPGEQEEDFYVRVSERLKHKNRIVTPEDYEHLILEHFPEVFQVKCLTHFAYPDHVRKGAVRIVLMPKVRVDEPFSEPRLDLNTLDAIRNHVVALASPFADIEVVNPNYERVRVRCRIRFDSPRNTGHLVRRLEADIRRFLCPWFAEPQGEVVFGGAVEKEDLMAFIYNLDYVRFVSRFSVVVLHVQDGRFSLSDSADDTPGQTAIRASNPWSALVPDAGHEVQIVDHMVHQAPEPMRIETMRIGSSFLITDKAEDPSGLPRMDIDRDSFLSVEIDI